MIIGKWYKVTQVTADGDKHNKAKTYGICVLEFDNGVRECFSPFELGVS